MALSPAPRFYLFNHSRTLRAFSSRTRALQKQSSTASFGGFGNPAPPRLPKEDQETFEALQRQSTGAFSTPRAVPKINQSPDSSPSEQLKEDSIISEQTRNLEGEDLSRLGHEHNKTIEAKGEGEELHPNVRRGAAPEFEGDTNPKTGEVGGPKNEPLRWGAAGEWSYNGRTTDF